MASFSYSLINNARYTPFTYDELSKPLLQQQAKLDQINSVYGEMMEKASVWDDLANAENDPVAYRKYKRYSEKLKGIADRFVKNGLSGEDKKNLLDMRREYASEIQPIEIAYKKRAALQEEQRKALLQNPTLMFQRNLNINNRASSLDRFLEDQNYDYGKQYSGELLRQQVGAMAARLATELQDSGRTDKSIGYAKQLMERYGFTRQQVLNAIYNPSDPRSSAVLNGIVESAMAASGIPQWANEQTMHQAYNYAREGLWNAIGTTKLGWQNDEKEAFNDRAALEREMQARREAEGRRNRQAAKAAATASQPVPNGLDTLSMLYGKNKLIATDEERRKTQELQVEAAKRLGFRIDGNGKIDKSHYEKGSGSMYYKLHSNITNDYNVYGKIQYKNKNNSLMSWQQFYEKNKNIGIDYHMTDTVTAGPPLNAKQKKNVLYKIYNQIYGDLKTIGYDDKAAGGNVARGNGKVYLGSVVDKYNNSYEANFSPSKYMSVFDIRNPESKGVLKLLNSARRINGVGKDGNFVLSGGISSFSKEAQEKIIQNIKDGQADVSLSKSHGKEGFIISTNGLESNVDMFVPISSLSNPVQAAIRKLKISNTPIKKELDGHSFSTIGEYSEYLKKNDSRFKDMNIIEIEQLAARSLGLDAIVNNMNSAFSVIMQGVFGQDVAKPTPWNNPMYSYNTAPLTVGDNYLGDEE